MKNLVDSLPIQTKRKIFEAILLEFEKYRHFKSKFKKNMDEVTFCERLEKAVERLPEKEKLIVQKKYMDPNGEHLTDYHMFNHILFPPVSVKTYHKYRYRAVVKLAIALNIECGVDYNALFFFKGR